jgi:hypothetical protein
MSPVRLIGLMAPPKKPERNEFRSTFNRSTTSFPEKSKRLQPFQVILAGHQSHREIYIMGSSASTIRFSFINGVSPWGWPNRETNQTSALRRIFIFG